MEIKVRRCLAVWYRCPQCGRERISAGMTPTKKHRESVGICLYCHVPEVITRRRSYTTWASDLSGVAGTCKELCAYYFPNIRVFRCAIAKKTAQRAKEAKEYFQIRAERLARTLWPEEEADFDLFTSDLESLNDDEHPF